MKYNEYAIKNIEDFLKVQLEKRDDCLRDFKDWMEFAMEANKYSPEIECENIFIWADDGMAGVSEVSIEFKPRKTDP